MTPENLLHYPFPSQKCTLGCPILDRCLNGGIPCNSITEIFAESGSARHSSAYNFPLRSTPSLPRRPFCFRSLLPTPNSLFPFAASTSSPIVSNLYSQAVIDEANCSSNYNNYNPCDNIYVQSVHSADQLLDIMPKIESFLV
ncbi:hypothetical protein MANES_01G004910v8 [Manihot esculenta]|nr:hypothetical protein MANES_01G004910v8 [Manihot esculenta]